MIVLSSSNYDEPLSVDEMCYGWIVGFLAMDFDHVVSLKSTIRTDDDDSPALLNARAVVYNVYVRKGVLDEYIARLERWYTIGCGMDATDKYIEFRFMGM